MFSVVPGVIAALVMAILTLVGCVSCILCAPASIAVKGTEDPGEVVMDEFAGQSLTFLAVPLVLARSMTGWESFLLAGFGFFVFRVFDITKPWPIRKLERLPTGWGILADDLAAGVGSAICVYAAMRLLVRV